MDGVPSMDEQRKMRLKGLDKHIRNELRRRMIHPEELAALGSCAREAEGKYPDDHAILIKLIKDVEREHSDRENALIDASNERGT